MKGEEVESPGAGFDQEFMEFQAALAGRYSIDRELGRGGMGIVYLARDVRLDRLVAIKLLPPRLSSNPPIRDRFLKEARTAAKLSHPNIVPIYSVDEVGPFVFFIMAYVAGESLGQRLRARGVLPPPEAARVLREVAWALAYAHYQGIIHRDVKPDNILLEQGGRRALVADFGIARIADGGPDAGVGQLVGTVQFMSPEQASGQILDARSDLFALGLVGYYALSGRAAYHADTLTELIALHRGPPAPPLAVAAPHVARALCSTIDRCLAVSPALRFQTGEQVAEALEHASGTAPELPAPIRSWLTRGSELKGAYKLWSIMWGIPTFFMAVALLSEGTASRYIWQGLAYALAGALAPWGIHTIWRTHQTRKLLAAGYGHADICLALKAQVEQRREELAFQWGPGPSTLAKVVRRLTFGSLAVAGAALGLMVYGSGQLQGMLPLDRIFTAAALTTVAGVVFGLFFPGRALPAKDRAAEFRLRLWSGPLGRGLVAMAGLGLKAQTGPEHVLHRPTELALGHAAEVLYQSLPEPHRRDLKELPETIRRLAQQGQDMRKRVDEMASLLAETTDDATRQHLAQTRDLWLQRLSQAVSALESIRLGLLRLHGGAETVGGVTADLEAAREIGQHIGLLLEAKQEIEADLSGGRRDT